MNVNLIFDLIILLTSCFPLYLSVKYITKKLLSSSIVLYPVFFIFFSSQSFFNIALGKPKYPNKFNSLSVSYDSELVSLIYFLMLTFLNLFFFLSIVYSKKSTVSFSSGSFVNVRYFLGVVSLSGVAVVFFSPAPEMYLSYAEVRKYIGEGIYNFHYIVAQCTLLSAVAVVAIRATYGSRIPFVISVILVLILTLDIYLNAKRLIFVFLPIYYLVDYLLLPCNKRAKYKILISSLVFVFLYNYYSNNVKHLDRVVTDEESYLYQRLEFGRDDILKYVIHKKLVNNGDIVEYPGQTIIGAFSIYLPRDYVSEFFDKPYPYAQYLTNSLLYDRVGPGLHGWTMTTSIIDEFIANFDYFGFIILLFFYYKFFKYTDSLCENEQGFRFLLYFILIFLHIVHSAPYAIAIYLAVLFFTKRFLIRFFCKAGFSKKLP